MYLNNIHGNQDIHERYKPLGDQRFLTFQELSREEKKKT